MKNSKFQSKTSPPLAEKINLPDDRRKSGFTLIEALVFLFIFVIITVTFFATWSMSTNYILFVKNRFLAISLANEKMEVVRNLAYDKIAHTSGTSPGNIHEDEYIAHSGRQFHVHTDIIKVDDPLDGTLGGSPNDIDFVDYKNVRIEVFWDDETHSVVLVSRFVPAGIESSAVGLGVLIINAFSDQSNSKVSDSKVEITDGSYSETRVTDSFGQVMIIGLPELIQRYEITLTQNDYEAVKTLPPYPTTSYNPTDTHASVIEGAINTINIIQNKTANLKVKTLDYLNQSVPNINFYLKGGRKMGMTNPILDEFGDPIEPIEPVYAIDSHTQTGTNGEKDFGVVSPGQYEFVLEETGYTVIGINRISPFSLVSEETLPLMVKISPDNVTALLMVIKNATAPISGASVHLTNTGGYDVTLITGVDGMAFFPNTNTPSFVAGTYNFTITAEGYTDASGQTTVTTDQLKTEPITLTES